MCVGRIKFGWEIAYPVWLHDILIDCQHNILLNWHNYSFTCYQIDNLLYPRFHGEILVISLVFGLFFWVIVFGKFRFRDVIVPGSANDFSPKSNVLCEELKQK